MEKIGSVGKVAEGLELKIFDENDEELPPNQIGEIVVRPRRPHIIFECYYKMPEKTLEACRNLWFHTGDIGYLDEDGYLYFVDRKKDAIRRRGENISSFEVEKVINSHPSVAESAAIPVPSELGEDEVMVIVVLKEGATLTPEELLAHCEDRMPHFAVPRYVEFRDFLPKTLTERVEKYKLKEHGVTENPWDREKAGYKLKR
jgi:crotonobetaine/carnitine-CoA ligase